VSDKPTDDATWREEKRVALENYLEKQRLRLIRETFVSLEDAIEGLKQGGRVGYSFNSVPVADEPWRAYGDEHQERA